MNTLTDIAVAAVHLDGQIIIRMESGEEIRFPVAENLRLAHGTPRQLNHIEISPFGLHWPDLDDRVAPLLPALARGVVLQMDQTTSADQGVLWHVAQRGAPALVDRGERLRAGGDHPKATQN